jgi:hypothetical protein
VTDERAGKRVTTGKSIRDFVFAGFAAGLAIIKSVQTETDVDLRVAEAAVALAVAAVFRHLTLHAPRLGFDRGHITKL